VNLSFPFFNLFCSPWYLAQQIPQFSEKSVLWSVLNQLPLSSCLVRNPRSLLHTSGVPSLASAVHCASVDGSRLLYYDFFSWSALPKSPSKSLTNSGFWSLPCLFFLVCGFCTGPALHCLYGSGEHKLWQLLPVFGLKSALDLSLVGLFVISLTLVVVNTSNLLLTSLELAPCTLSLK